MLQEPLHLTATTRATSGTETGFNAKSLRNPLSVPIELLEVKFQIIRASVESDEPNPGGVAVNMVLDEHPLTNGFVPIWCLGPQRNIVHETSGMKFAEFSWKLDRPLILGSGQLVEPKIQQSGQIVAPLDVRISYSCRAPAKPRAAGSRLVVPYVAAYTSKPMDAYSLEGDDDTSLETDLRNQFLVPLDVSRIVGRVSVFRRDPETNVQTNSEAGHADVASRLLKMRLSSSKGVELVRDFVTFRQIFNAQTRSFECPHTMDPGEIYQAFVRRDVVAIPDPNFRCQAFVSIVGHREVMA